MILVIRYETNLKNTGDMMSYRPNIVNFTLAGSNEKEGLYEFKMSLADGTECRVFSQRNPEWTLTNISRLLTTPCPVCHKDFICKCMDMFHDEFLEQINSKQLFEKALS
ncbi:hypothetical protein ASL14_05010 [Paenibacillus sp. IHB B 3084]|uniref:hypothetical protein n=1 Tax=Paenibacillus sp. IHB B 3084 TaxID=867076 RepID=UPI00072278B6|nr:hypothetical protein [Paenibacillus sp. IHB B 3084]ALP35621.1 hypothetical protein ASL14_05010 [Paenibacillus sp. IHB B 3084]